MKSLGIAGVAAAIAVAGQLAPAPVLAQDSGGGLPPLRQSWTADGRSFLRGDVLTVVIDEYTVANQQTGTSAQRSRTQDAEAGAGAGTAVSGAAVVARSSTRGDSRERGEARRVTTFSGEIAVTVSEVSSNGMLRIQGTKRIVVDRGTQELRLSGWVRPQDVSGRNTVESSRVAELELSHMSGGSLGKPRRGLLGKVLDLIWP